MLILFAALSTCDPGNILETIRAAKQQRVRVSVVGLAAEVHICRRITEVRALVDGGRTLHQPELLRLTRSTSSFCVYAAHCYEGVQHTRATSPAGADMTYR